MSRGERQLKKQQEQSLKSAHDKLRVTVPVEHFLIQELSHGKYLAKDLLLGQQGSDTPLEFKDLPKRGSKTKTNKEEGEDAAKKPDKDNDVDPAHPDGDNEVDGGKNSHNYGTTRTNDQKPFEHHSACLLRTNVPSGLTDILIILLSNKATAQ